MSMLFTVLPGAIGGNAVAGSYRKRVHPRAGTDVDDGGGEMQPIKWVTLSLVTTLNRGAPAPQCPSSRTSQPISVSVIPCTPSIVAPPAALVAVGQSFVRYSAWSELPASDRPSCVTQAPVPQPVLSGS